MIALWMAYAVALSALVGAVALCADRLCRLSGRATRLAWAAALIVSFAAPLALALRPAPALPEAAVDAIVAGFGPSLIGIQVMHAGGRLAGLGDPVQVFAVGIGAQADLDALETALIPFDEGRRAPNFVEDPHADPAQLWDPATLERLRAVKAAVDPEDAVRSNHPLS